MAAFIKAEFTRFLGDEEGATAIEYALIAAFVGIAMISALSTIAPGLNGIFTSLATTLLAAAL